MSIMVDNQTCELCGGAGYFRFGRTQPDGTLSEERVPCDCMVGPDSSGHYHYRPLLSGHMGGPDRKSSRGTKEEE